MGLLHPEALVWGALAALVVACYVVRFARRQRDVSSMMLWQRAIARRKPWRRRQRLVSLVAQLCILAVLVVALAEPFWSGRMGSARSIVLIVDTSASMNATDVETSRLWKARLDAQRLIDDLGPHEQMAILSAGSVVRLHTPFTDDRKTLNEALAQIEPRDGANRMDQAVSLARRLLEEMDESAVIVLSDGCFDGAAELSSADDVTLVVHNSTSAADPSTRPDNVGITRLGARPSLTKPGTYELFVEAANYGAKSMTVDLTLGASAASGPLELPPGETVQRVISYDGQAGGMLIARLDAEDRLAADNLAMITLSPVGARTVAFFDDVASGNEVVSKRLKAALELAAPGHVTIANRNASGQVTGNNLPTCVLTSYIPDQFPDGPVLAFAPAGDCEWWESNDVVDGPFVLPREIQTPQLSTVLKDTGWQDLVIDGLLRVTFKQPPDEVVRADSGEPVFSLWNRPQGPVMLVHLPLEKTDWTVQPGFPVFVSNALQWLRQERPAKVAAFTTADVVTLASPGDREMQLRSPRDVSNPFRAGQTMLGPLETVGVWSLLEGAGGGDEGTTSDTADVVFPVSILDARESDLSPEAGIDYAALPLAEKSSASPLWMLFVAGAIVLLLAEYVLYHRRALI